MKDDLTEEKERRDSTGTVGLISRFLPSDEFEVTCIRQETTSSGRERIHQLGVRLGAETIFVGVPEAVFLIQSGKRFFVNRAGSKTFLRTMLSSNGRPYVETKDDSTHLNNLKSLPECREVGRKKPEEKVSTPSPEVEPGAELEHRGGKLSRAGWMWLLGALALLTFFGQAVIFSSVRILDLPQETYLLIVCAVLLLSLAGVLVFRKTSQEVVEHFFQRRRRGWLVLLAVLLLLFLQLFFLNPGTPTIAFEAIPDRTFLDPDFFVIANAGGGEPVSFKPSLDRFCSVTKEGLVHIIHAGGCAVTAYSAANPRVSAVTRTFTIQRKPQTLTLTRIPDRVFGDPDFPLAAQASSSLPVSFTSSGACAILKDAGRILGTGSCTITARQDGDDNYLPAPEVKQVVAIEKKAQAIHFSGPGDPSLSQPFVPLSASVSSGLPVSFSTTDLSTCKTDGNVVQITGKGTCSITISQPGNENYLAAPEVKQTYQVSSIPLASADDQVITFGPLSPVVFGSPDFAVSASASSGLAVGFTASGKCRIAGGSVTVTGAGTCTITAHQDGNDRTHPAEPVSQTLTIAKATPVIFWGNPDEIRPGTPLGPAQLFASAGAVVWNAQTPYTFVPGTYTYTPGFGAVLPEGIHPLHMVFTPADPENYNRNEATVSICVCASHECD